MATKGAKTLRPKKATVKDVSAKQASNVKGGATLAASPAVLANSSATFASRERLSETIDPTILRKR